MLALARKDKSYKFGKLAASVLSIVKSKIVDNKTSFATVSGLFGQVALIYSKLVTCTAEELCDEYKGELNNENAEEDLKSLETQRRSIVRHAIQREKRVVVRWLEIKIWSKLLFREKIAIIFYCINIRRS